MDLRYVPNQMTEEIDLGYQDRLRQFIDSAVQELKNKYPPSSQVSLNSVGEAQNDHSVYLGYGGNLFFYWKLNYLTNLYTEELLQAAESSAKKLPEIENQAFTFLMGKIGIVSLLAVIYKDENYVKIIEETIDLNPEELELLYGAAGSLYILGFLLKYFPSVTRKNQLISKIQVIYQSIVSKKNKTDQLLFKFPSETGRTYLGGAHGIIGLVYILIQLREYLPDCDSILISNLDLILTLQLPSGNFPVSYGENSDKLVHFCHGSPGAVPLMCLAYQVYNKQAYLDCAIKAGEDIWKRGLIKKGYGLCHGVAGNGYSFLALFNTTGEQVWLNKAIKFAETIAFDTNFHEIVQNYDDPQRYQVGVPDHPFSLMEGAAGTICYLIDCLNPLSALFPAYDI
jgi:lantibiotic modifying enzyme